MRQATLNLLGTLSASILLAVACPIGAMARSLDGGTSGGGGTITYPKSQEIKNAIIEVFESDDHSDKDSQFRSALWAMNRRRAEIQDPTLKKVFKSFFTDAEIGIPAALLVSSVVRPKIQYEPCIDKDGQVRAASVISVNLGKGWPKQTSQLSYGLEFEEKYSVEFCYSISKLKEVPSANLQQQLIILTIHELTHVFGYNEPVALKVQNYLLDSGRQLVNDSKDSMDFLIMQVKEMGEITSNLEQSLNDPDMQLCMKVGTLAHAISQIEVFAEALRSTSQASGRPLVFSGDVQRAINDLNPAAAELHNFCGQSYGNYPRTGKGNRQVLKKSLHLIAQQIEKFYDLLKIDVQESN